MIKPARILTEADIVEAELQRRHDEVARLTRRLAELRGGLVPAPVAAPARPTLSIVGDADAVVPLAEIERRYVLQILARFHGNRTHTARALGIGTNTLWRKLKAWGEPPARDAD